MSATSPTQLSYDVAASSLALAGRKLGRLCNPGLPGHRQLKEETLRGTGTTARSAERDLNTYSTLPS